MKSACRHNNLDMIKYLIKKNCPLDINCFILLATQKRPDSIVYMYENGYCPVDIRITNAAARNCARTLSYLLVHKFPHDISTWREVVATEHIIIIKMLYNENKYMDYMITNKLRGETCSRLANNLVCLKWAHENGFTWDEVSCQEAAKFGNIQ